MRVGLLAASRIATAAVVVPSREVDRVDVVAVAARDQARAGEAAERWGIPLVFGSYDEMLGSGEIDAVYIGTPASLHRPGVERAAAHGLHVLCEKPFAANADDARQAAQAARGSDRVVMEAFHWRYHPIVDQMREVLDRLGPVRRVEAWFDVEEGRIGGDDIRWDFDLGGGATMDLGCYSIGWARWAVDEVPTVIAARADATGDGVDAWLEAELAFPSGATGVIRSSMVASRSGSGLVVEAGGGVMRVENPLAPQHGSSIAVETDTGEERIDVPRSSTYLHQLIAFRDAVEVGASFPTGPEEAVVGMEIIDACYRAAGLPVRPSGD